MNAPFLGYVYETKNLVNGKFYIGIKWDRRVALGKICAWYLGSGPILRRAVEKYGKERFSVRALSWHTSREELSRAEKETIADYRRRYGSKRLYNIKDGGIGGGSPGRRGPSGYHLTEEHKEAIRKAQRGNKHSLGRKRTPEEKAAISAVHKGRKQKSTQVWRRAAALRGQKRTDEQRGRLRQAHLGVKLSPEHIARRTAGQLRMNFRREALATAARAFDLIDNPLTLKALLLKAEVAEMGIPV